MGDGARLRRIDDPLGNVGPEPGLPTSRTERKPPRNGGLDDRRGNQRQPGNLRLPIGKRPSRARRKRVERHTGSGQRLSLNAQPASQPLVDLLGRKLLNDDAPPDGQQLDGMIDGGREVGNVVQHAAKADDVKRLGREPIGWPEARLHDDGSRTLQRATSARTGNGSSIKSRHVPTGDRERARNRAKARSHVEHALTRRRRRERLLHPRRIEQPSDRRMTPTRRPDLGPLHEAVQRPIDVGGMLHAVLAHASQPTKTALALPADTMRSVTGARRLLVLAAALAALVAGCGGDEPVQTSTAAPPPDPTGSNAQTISPFDTLGTAAPGVETGSVAFPALDPQGVLALAAQRPDGRVRYEAVLDGTSQEIIITRLASRAAVTVTRRAAQSALASTSTMPRSAGRA